MSRLLGAVAQNPKNLGLGIDEDTAAVVSRAEHVRAIGSGAIYVVDGAEVSYSSLSEKNPEGIVSIFDVRLHVLGKEDCYELSSRRPTISKKKEHEANRSSGQ
jgi:cyanophycinase